MPHYVILNSVKNTTPQVVQTIDGTLTAARQWAKTEGKKCMEPGDRLDIAFVKDSLTAFGEIVLVSNGAGDEPTEPKTTPDAITAPTATA